MIGIIIEVNDDNSGRPLISLVMVKSCQLPNLIHRGYDMKSVSTFR